MINKAKKNKLKIRILNILTVIIIIAILACVAGVIALNMEYTAGDNMYRDLADSFLIFDEEETDYFPDESEPIEGTDDITAESDISENTSGINENTEPSPAQTTQKPEPQTTAAPAKKITKVNFSALREINENVVGWIICDGTAISYPIVRTYSAQDYDYYLTHLFNGNKNKLGTIFTDLRNDPWNDKVTILYGHNMLNGTMFSSLLKYSSQSYYDLHPTMRLLTPDGNYTIKLFSGYMTTVESDAFTLGYGSLAMEKFLTSVKAASAFQSDIIPTSDDNIITMSTCDSNTSRIDNRFIVHGILVKD